MNGADSKPAGPGPSEGVKGWLSLLVIVHLCCVLTVLAANFRRSIGMGNSTLLGRLVSIYAPYTQLLNFDPSAARFDLTLGRVVDDDAVLIVDLYPDADSPLDSQTRLATARLPGGESRWLEGRRRYLALAKTVQFYSPVEEEPSEFAQAQTTAIAKSVGRRLMDEHSARRAVVRCVRRMSQPRDPTALNPGFPPDDPTADEYDVVLLTADVWIDDEGQTQAARRAARAELAPLTGGSP